MFSMQLQLYYFSKEQIFQKLSNNYLIGSLNSIHADWCFYFCVELESNMNMFK